MAQAAAQGRWNNRLSSAIGCGQTHRAGTSTIAINDFMQAGGDDYAEFANGIDVKDTGIRLRDVVSDYIKVKKVVTPVIDGRIQIVNQ